MSEQSAGGVPPDPSAGEELSPEQEQMLRQMEEEMRRVRVQDLITQSVVSILNLAHRRLVKEDERDLEQARVGIEAVRATVELLDEEPQREVKNALAQVQMMYAQIAGEGAGPAAGEGGGTTAPSAAAPEGVQKPPPGLWIPGSG